MQRLRFILAKHWCADRPISMDIRIKKYSILGSLQDQNDGVFEMPFSDDENIKDLRAHLLPDFFHGLKWLLPEKFSNSNHITTS